MKVDLSKIPIEVLIGALIERKDELFIKGKPGLLISLAFQLRMLLGATACVDGIPFRYNKGKIELMALRRFTGAFPGKLVLDGGTIAKGESVKDALRRHFQEDFGVEIMIAGIPFDVTQYRKEGPDDQWLHDPGKEHNVGPVYLVHIVSGIPNSRLGPVEWFSEDRMPPDEEFGYTTWRVYRNFFRVLASVPQFLLRA